MESSQQSDDPVWRGNRPEFWNAATHGFGAILSAAGLMLLIPLARERTVPVGGSIMLFAILLIAVYSCSALSHYFRGAKLRSLFRRLDQAFIYLLIVGSYSPFSTAFQHGPWWWTTLALMWLVAFVGFVSKLFFEHRVESVSVWIYLALGWSPILIGMPLAGLVPTAAIRMILLGGFFYTAGTWFLFKDHKVWYFHAIWHLFVIAGSISHFLGVWWYV